MDILLDEENKRVAQLGREVSDETLSGFTEEQLWVLYRGVSSLDYRRDSSESRERFAQMLRDYGIRTYGWYCGGRYLNRGGKE